MFIHLPYCEIICLQIKLSRQVGSGYVSKSIVMANVSRNLVIFTLEL